MYLLFHILLAHIAFSQAALLECDFESNCLDFIGDQSWGLTDGNHPNTIKYDHTLNTSDGHYFFYAPKSDPPFFRYYSEIRTKDWLPMNSTDQSLCFSMWYFTPRFNLPFSIQIVQGDDEALTRILKTVPGKDPSINTWTQVNISLPAEKIKLFIRLNSSVAPLDFDDLSIDYCDAPGPTPSSTLYKCDFESSCQEDFIVLPNYSYEWLTMTAGNASKFDTGAPRIDYTFKNETGHYALVPASNIMDIAGASYLALEQWFNITENESFCLNFQYYGYGPLYPTHLIVFAQLSSEWQPIQSIWPPRYGQYGYTIGKWTWAIINLPIGYYRLLFRIDNAELYTGSFAIDNISVTSCDYPPTEFVGDGSLLSFSCDFDDLTMCLMVNGNRFTPVNYNFTILTAATVPNPALGPLVDYTENSTHGGFLYWNRTFPYTIGDYGLTQHSIPVAANAAMCIRFAYYVKSQIVDRNGTMLSLGVSGCVGAMLWSQSLDDSQGWTVVTIPVPKYPCSQTFSLSVSQKDTVPVSVAFDGIEVIQCALLPPNTTTTSTTTTTTSTTTSTTTVSTDTSSRTIMTTTSTSSETTTTTAPTTATITTITTTSSPITKPSSSGPRSNVPFYRSGIILSVMSLLCYHLQ